jgi:RND family efflux transporter MFP subunit
MATPSAGFAVPLADFAAALLSEREVAPRARLTAQYVSQLLPDCDISIYVLEDEGAPFWKHAASEGDVSHEMAEVPFDSCTLGAMGEKRETMLFAAADLAREDYGHLDIKRSFSAISCVPIALEEVMVGAIEIISHAQSPSDAALEAVGELAEVAALGLATAVAYEKERNGSLQSISRLTELYDLELVFSSTLEMDDLMPLITSKVQQLANVQAVNLWMVADEDRIMLAHTTGTEPTYEPGIELGEGECIASDVADNGDMVLIAEPTDERLQKRNGDRTAEEGAVFSLMAVPLFQDGKAVGVLEAINRNDGQAFDEDDLFLLNTVASAAATSLHNASLLTAERKVEILETLVKVSTEIASTLNLERVLKAIVNGPEAIIPYERASIVLDHHGKLELKAVSGEEEVKHADPDMKRLKATLDFAAIYPHEIYVNQEGESAEDIDEEDPDIRAQFAEYFAQSGVRSFYALPLSDDQGRVGILCLESSETDFLDAARLEIVKVLAAQATVALRNANLYREVPLIGVLEPILRRKEAFLNLKRGRRISRVVLAVAVVVFLVAVPLPMRLDGDATVAPQRTAQIQAETEGVVKSVNVREGDPVKPGTLLGQLEDWNYQSDLAAAKQKQGTALAEMNRALAMNDSATAGARRIEADYWSSEVKRAEERVEHTRLRSAIDGVVTTPHVEDSVGRHLDAGDTFAEVANTERAVVDVAIDEHEAALLEPGSNAAVMLESFPTHPFHGRVVAVSPRLTADAEHRFAFARVEIDNPGGLVHPGMQGRGKVSSGWHPAGYVLFRRPGIWAWSKLWNWFGW